MINFGPIKTYILIASLFTLLLSGCTTSTLHYTDEQTKTHEATSAFEKYVSAASNANSFEDLTDHFSKIDRLKIEKSIGWQRLAFSASYKALKNGSCKKITTKGLTVNRAQIDCQGDFRYQSYFYGTSYERMHLRTYMVKSDGIWYISRSGLAHTQQAGKGTEFNRIGLKFKHDLDIK